MVIFELQVVNWRINNEQTLLAHTLIVPELGSIVS